ncbi:MarR family winged helix-turn-helix transcriptional regulator [Ancylobacter sp. Lp-2]|uniref:MarR family winged helix-turn-helix transcriptional regulator n=1 Tax=Ancylobacter sp. Lp-2 TaxID=2881339 RepID=UPI001E5663D6|nr:MarR family winged helix-turn-helix transcriptional regulator [Ancylobacter sp. Lp-2]MCB4771376.1 MarR family winged helix-turn-helix transcriptional regulator [Ancylobacter sp. Lp-2]
MDTPPEDDIGHLPGFLIRRCNQVAMAIFLDETSGFDLSPAQYGALSVVAADPGIDQTRLMERSALDRSSVTKCVERLEARGLIRREVDAADRRVRRLYVTEQGQNLRHAVREHVLRSQARLLAPLGAERATLLLAMLKELADSHNAASRVPLRDIDAA